MVETGLEEAGLEEVGLEKAGVDEAGLEEPGLESPGMEEERNRVYQTTLVKRVSNYWRKRKITNQS